MTLQKETLQEEAFLINSRPDIRVGFKKAILSTERAQDEVTVWCRLPSAPGNLKCFHPTGDWQ
jgi:hypothetical protein